jgi:acetyl esterase/lipase
MPSLRSKAVRLVLKYGLVKTGEDGAPLAEARQQMERAAARVKSAPGVTIESVSAGGVPAEWVSARNADRDRAVLYLHGGSYTQGSPLSHRGITTRLAVASGARVLVIAYRLAPEHPFPAAVEDTMTAYRWLLGEGIAPQHMAFAGDSAGGGLAVGAAVALRDAGDPLPGALACISPWTDMKGTGRSVVTRAKADPWLKADGLAAAGKVYVGDADPRTPLASPIYADLRGLPPLLIQVGTDEILLDDSNRLSERAKAAGVTVTLEVWQGMWHVWHAFGGYIPEADRAIQVIGDFVRRHTM